MEPLVREQLHLCGEALRRHGLRPIRHVVVAEDGDAVREGRNRERLLSRAVESESNRRAQPRGALRQVRGDEQVDGNHDGEKRDAADQRRLQVPQDDPHNVRTSK